MKPVRDILIWDSPNKPSNIPNNFTIVLWRNYLSHDFVSMVSIQQLAENKAFFLRKRYLSWIYDLGILEIQGKRVIDHFSVRPGFSAWWMSLLSEKCNFDKSPQIFDALKLMAFEDWAKDQNVGRVLLVSANKALAKSISLSSCRAKWSNFEWQHNLREDSTFPFLRRIYIKLPNALKALIWLARYIHSNWALRGVGVLPWRQTTGHITFVSYLFNLVPDKNSIHKFKSNYWGSLPELLNNENLITNWLHIYIKDSLVPSASNAAHKLQGFNEVSQGKQIHTSLESFLNVTILIRTLKDWIHLIWSSRGLEDYISQITSNGLSLWPLFTEEWGDSIKGITSVSNILHLNLFEAALSELPNQQLGLYLQENQGWELAMIWAWKSTGHSQIIGCAHTAVRYWDLRYFHDPRCYIRGEINSLPMPDKVAINGPASLLSYIEGGYPADDLEEVEALRYLYLNELLGFRYDDLLSKSHNLRLLVLGDYNVNQTRAQMRLLEEAQTLLSKDITIIVKPHPACPINATDYPTLTMMVSTEPLRKLLPNCDVVFTGPVTASALDAFCAGLPIITMLDVNSLNLSPLRGHKSVQFIHTPVDLSRAIMNSAAYPCNLNQGIGFFHLNEDLWRWRKFLLVSNNF
jgi:surface carbohydrate biosynthesis protein (TIGR04326 family)